MDAELEYENQLKINIKELNDNLEIKYSEDSRHNDKVCYWADIHLCSRITTRLYCELRKVVKDDNVNWNAKVYYDSLVNGTKTSVIVFPDSYCLHLTFTEEEAFNLAKGIVKCHVDYIIDIIASTQI